MSRLLLLCMAACLLLHPVPVRAEIVIDFDALPLGPFNSHTVGPYVISTIGEGMSVVDGTAGCSPTCPSNGTRYLEGAGFGIVGGLVIERTDLESFDVVSIDLAEGSLATPPALSLLSVWAEPPPMPPSLSPVLDGVNDGAGGQDDFETLFLPPSFYGLTGLGLINFEPAAHFSVDRIVIAGELPPGSAEIEFTSDDRFWGEVGYLCDQFDCFYTSVFTSPLTPFEAFSYGTQDSSIVVGTMTGTGFVAARADDHGGLVEQHSVFDVSFTVLEPIPISLEGTLTQSDLNGSTTEMELRRGTTVIFARTGASGTLPFQYREILPVGDYSIVVAAISNSANQSASYEFEFKQMEMLPAPVLGPGGLLLLVLGIMAAARRVSKQV